MDNVNKEWVQQGAENLIFGAGRLAEGERALIVVDASTRDIGEFLQRLCQERNYDCRLMEKHGAKMHGSEPSEDVANAMLNSDLIFGLTAFSMAHTKARKAATDAGRRYLSLPDYGWDVLASPAMRVDFGSQRNLSVRLADMLNSAKASRVTTALGTNITLDLYGRSANNSDGLLDTPGGLSSPPDMEVNIAPVEEESEGVLVVDGSIPHPRLGLLKAPVSLHIRGGIIREIQSEDTNIVAILEDLFRPHGDASRVLAEFGFGLNPSARLCGRMLEDEGTMGAIHCGFGSNATIGGKNVVPFHLDFIVMRPDVWLDDEKIMTNGQFVGRLASKGVC